MSLTATLTCEQASQRPWSVLVVGAGPAGSLAATLLARDGLAVLLVDQAHFPRSKVCGSCLNGRALAALEDAGLPELLRQCGSVPLQRFHLAAARAEAELPLPAGVALSREQLDTALIQAACQAGADFLPGHRATLLPAVPGSPRRLILQAGTTEVPVQADLVVAAYGLAGTLEGRKPLAEPEPESRIGAGVLVETEESFYRTGGIYMACAAGGYVGLVRVEDGRLDVACAAEPSEVRAAGGPGPLAVRLLEHVGWPVPSGLAQVHWRGTPALTRSSRQVADYRLFALGDATGYVEPFTGEGMAWAMSSAVALAPLARTAARHWQDHLSQVWTRRHRQVVGRRQRTCRLAAAVLRRPLLTNALVSLLKWLPALAGPVVAGLNRPSRAAPESVDLPAAEISLS